MTRLFGVIGHPIAHSLSPAMHTAGLEALRLDACYGAFDVPPKFLRPMLRALVLAGVEGLNVTVPLKEAVLPLVDRLDATAKAIGAVNTLVIRNRRITGYNTDAVGFSESLIEELGGIPNAQVLLLGAGGAARAVAFALTGLGPRTIWVANRTPRRAEALVKWLRRSLGRRTRPHVAQIPWRAETLRAAAGAADLVVNATSVGMRAGEAPPIDPEWLRPATRVYDLIYQRETALVQGARGRGCIAANGESMLLYQGAASLRLWTRRTPPIQEMRAALRHAVRNAEFGMRSKI